jgi:hypothetical protein
MLKHRLPPRMPVGLLMLLLLVKLSPHLLNVIPQGVVFPARVIEHLLQLLNVFNGCQKVSR